jgi:hypothetical protein
MTDTEHHTGITRPMGDAGRLGVWGQRQPKRNAVGEFIK